MADRAAGGRTRYAVITGDMAGHAAHDRAFSTAFGVRRGVSDCQCSGKSEGGECSFQLRLLLS